jgi:hypothetical protein
MKPLHILASAMATLIAAIGPVHAGGDLNDTLKKIKESGTITLGTRESSVT